MSIKKTGIIEGLKDISKETGVIRPRVGKPGSRIVAAALLLAVAGCTPTGTTTTVAVPTLAQATTVLIDAAACQADLKGMKGVTLANAAKAATDPACVAALQAAQAQGAAPNAVVAVKPAS